MHIDQIFLLILPISLFFITLILIFVLRENDNRKRGLANVRRLTDKYKNELELQSNDFKVEVAELNAKIDNKNMQIRELLKTVTAEINTMKSYSDDMANLRHSMDTYREALAALAKLTTEADTKIGQIENDVQRLESIKSIIDTFRMDMEDADEHLKQHEGTVIQLQKDTISHLEESLSTFKAETDRTLEDTKSAVMQYNELLEEKLEATKQASDSLHASGLELMSSLGNRASEQQALAAQVDELEKTKTLLSKTLLNLNQQIKEKKSVASQLDDMARQESLKLAHLRETIVKAEADKEPSIVQPSDNFANEIKTIVEENSAQSGSSKTDYYGPTEEIVF